MDSSSVKGKKGLVLKTLERCRSFGSQRRSPSPTSKAGSTSPRSAEKHRVAPEGYFTVYVGPDKERMLIKTELANHPLFRSLLDEAEMEYGFSIDGPLVLPCNRDRFLQVLGKVEQEESADAARNKVRTASPVRRFTGGRLCWVRNHQAITARDYWLKELFGLFQAIG